MATHNGRNPTYIEVTILDLGPLTESATKEFNEHPEKFNLDPQYEHTAKVAFGPWGIVDANDGLYVLCNEGVMYGPITDNEPHEVQFHYDSQVKPGVEVEHKHTISMFPKASIKQKPDELRAMAGEEKVNLADFVRVFGSRLEANYSTLKSYLEKRVERPEVVA